MSIACITSFIIAMINGQPLHLASFGNWHIWLGLTIGAVCNILSTFLGNFALQHLNATIGTQLLLMDNVFAAILGYFIYREIVTPIEILGAIIIIGSVYISNKFLE
jgi:drug/metabolite transporter (DMT)-like permease